jgi:hypothetical protein
MEAETPVILVTFTPVILAENELMDAIADPVQPFVSVK